MSSPSIAASNADLLNWQREQIRTGAYEEIGKCWLVVLEASAGAATPSANVANVLGSRIEFYNWMPRIAQTRDRGNLLLLDPLIRADGSVGLPDIPDPSWIPGVPTAEDFFEDPETQQKPKDYVAPKAPMIRQDLRDRARGVLKGTNFLVFGPVVQILIRPHALPEGWIAYCSASAGTAGSQGTQMELLIDEKTGEAFFFGGRFNIERAG